MVEYFDWECTKCGQYICNATTEKNPETYVNSYGKYTYACRNGFNAEWVPVRAHERDMEAVRTCIHSD